MTWRVAKSLNILLDQLNALYPNRSKVSDGSIGDADHATRDSDHNPWYGPGIVTARDFTHDQGNLDCHDLAAWLVASGDKRIKYIIWNRRIWDRANGWQPYYGSNTHEHHLHLSVVASPLCDSTAAWKLGEAPDMQADERSWLADLHMTVVSGARRDKQLNKDLAYLKDQLFTATTEAINRAAQAKDEAVAAKMAVVVVDKKLTELAMSIARIQAGGVDYAVLAKAVADEQARRMAE